MTASQTPLRPGGATPAGGGTPRKAVHGTRSKYTLGCRCEPCTEANRAYKADYKELLRNLPMSMIPHGLTGYDDAGCRCDTCKAAKSKANRRKYEANAEQWSERSRARGRALWALAKQPAHKAEFEQLAASYGADKRRRDKAVRELAKRHPVEFQRLLTDESIRLAVAS